MALDAGMTAFVTGADGFIGMELVRVLRARGHQVFGLTGTPGGAERVRRAGGVPVTGDPSEPGIWQDEVLVDWVFHLAPHPGCGPGLTSRRVESVARVQMRMDSLLLDSLERGVTRRIVYLSDTSYYGPTGPRPVTEDDPPRPGPWGRCLAPALERLEGYVLAGLPIVTAFAGWVYGNGSWFRERVIEPVLAGRRVVQIGKGGPWVSPIHVHDCARGLVHLAERGEAGGRYLLVNQEPVRTHDFPATFARLANRPLHVWHVPEAVARLVVGPLLAEYLRADAVFSNIRLRGLGFRCLYPTLEQGLEQVLGALNE